MNFVKSWNFTQKMISFESKFEKNLFGHLKRGRLYRISFANVRTWGGYILHVEIGEGCTFLYSKPFLSHETRMIEVRRGKWIVYLGRERNGHGLFHHVICDDIAGYIPARIGMRFKRVTKRQMIRMVGDEEAKGV